MTGSPCRPSGCSRRHLQGFSLIEVLAVVALISVVVFVALNFYTDLARATSRASNHTHDIRRAVAIMDRVARDFESAMLEVKPANMDPTRHPWLFVGESQLGGPGADHVKFVTRNHDPTRSDNPESDIAVVAYTVERDESGLLSLYRWSSPQLPDSLDRSFPFADDERSYLMADELYSFAILFLGPNGEESTSWDSTQLERSSSLPTAVEIQVALASADMYDDTDPEVYKRRALIRVRPLDFEKLLDPTGESGGQDDEDDEDNEDDEANEGSGDSSDSDDGNTNTAGMTIGECVDLSAIDESIPHGDLLRSLVAGNPNLPWDRSDAASLPASIVRPACR